MLVPVSLGLISNQLGVVVQKKHLWKRRTQILFLAAIGSSLGVGVAAVKEISWF